MCREQKGGDRQKLHHLIRVHSMDAGKVRCHTPTITLDRICVCPSQRLSHAVVLWYGWSQVVKAEGKPNDLLDRIRNDPDFAAVRSSRLSNDSLMMEWQSVNGECGGHSPPQAASSTD